MQSTQKVAEEILWCRPVTRFRDWVEYEDEKELQAICNKNLSLIFEDYVIVWHAPGRRIVLECLRGLVLVLLTTTLHLQYLEVSTALIERPACQDMWRDT